MSIPLLDLAVEYSCEGGLFSGFSMPTGLPRHYRRGDLRLVTHCRVWPWLDGAGLFAEGAEFAGVDLEGGGGDVFLEVRDAGGAGDGEHDGRAPEEPGEGELGWSDLQVRGGASEGAFRAGQLTGAERKPGNETDVGAFAEFEDAFGGAVGDAVAVLHGDDGNDFLRVLDLLDADFGETDVLDLSLRLQILQRAELIRGGNF